MNDVLDDRSDRWASAGLPDACPSCGESEMLYAVVSEWDGETAAKATVYCDRLGCEERWSWPAESDTERGE